MTEENRPEPALPIGGKPKLRLLVVSSDTYPPVRVDVAVLFCEELARRGHRIDWIMQSEAACEKPYTVTLGGGSAWVGPTDLGPALFNRVRKHVRGILHDLSLISRLRDYDIIEVKDKFLSGLAAVLAARLRRKRFVYWLSWPYPEEYLLRATDGTARYPLLYRVRGHAFRLLLYRVLLPAADHVFVQSEQMRSDIAAQGIPVEKMTAVPMGVKLEAGGLPDPGQRRLLPPGDKVILYLGTLSRVRRLDFLVRVLQRVRCDEPGARLYFVGRGDDLTDEQQLIDEARQCGLTDAVVLTGQKPRAEAFQYVREADLCVSPFFPNPILNSTSPTKLVEYMALGKAVVANDHPEQRLVIEESGAGLCVPYDEELFAAAIVTLLRDPARAADMGKKGRRYVENRRSYAVLAESVERELLSVAGGGRNLA